MRVYGVFGESLDFGELGIVCDPNKVGNPKYAPKAMLKLLVYGVFVWDREFTEMRIGDTLQGILRVAYGGIKAGS